MQVSVPCLWPFTSIAVDAAGDVNLCPCVQWTDMAPVGNVSKNDLLEIWNSEKALEYRKYFLAGKVTGLCDPEACPYLRNPEKVSSEGKYLSAENLKALLSKQPFMPSVFTRVKLDTSRRCNIRCKMCRDSYIQVDEQPTTRLALEQLAPLWESIIEISPASAGEPLFIPEIIALLESDLLLRKRVQVELVTNATLFTAAMWERIEHNRFSYVKVSLDAVSADIYEIIRRGASFKKVLNNLYLITEQKRRGKIQKIQYTFVVMRTNLGILPEAVRFAKKMEVDALKLMQLNGNLAPDEILRPEDKQRLVKLLQEPIMRDPIVDHWGMLRYLEPCGNTI